MIVVSRWSVLQDQSSSASVSTINPMNEVLSDPLDIPAIAEYAVSIRKLALMYDKF